jgi:regulator of protease activity HflC (stomatin/prohibitin superfamily)
VKVAQVVADGQKQAAQISAQQELDVASIQRQVAELDAQRTEILGKAEADVVQLKSDAAAKGAKMLVDALGSSQAYNLYTFAQNFQPTDLKLIFAGPGTFWTDLKSFQDLAGTKVMEEGK